MSRADRTAIAAQADIDTPETVPSYGVPLETENVGLNRNTIDINETLGSRGPTTSEYGLRFAEGSMNGACRPVSFPLLLASFMGAPVTAVVTASTVWTHTHDPLAMDYPVPLTVWGVNNDPVREQDGTLVADPLVNVFEGAVGNQLTLSAEVDNYLRYEATMVSKGLSAAVEAPPSITTDTSRKWVFNQILVQIKIGGGSLTEVYAGSFSFVYNNNLITDLGRLGSNSLTDIPLGPEIESTLTMTFQRDIYDHYLRALEDSPSQVGIKLTAEGSTIASTHKYTFSLDFPYVETVSAPIERSGGETTRDVEVTFNVVTDPTTGKLVTPVIKNATDGALYAG